MALTTFTPEQRAKAADARRRAVAESKYRRDWLDADVWLLLASERGIRLPAWHRAPTARKLIQAHQSLEETPFREVYGCSAAALIARNPTMPLRAFIGQMLERVL